MKNYDFAVVHIPHASVSIPEYYRKTILLDDSQLSRELARMTDAFCDELYDAPGFNHRLIAPVSRLVCDMERFRDDSQEPCAKKGQGLMYIKTAAGRQLREYNEALRNQILTELYDPHHQRLTDMVDKALEKHGKCLIIDGHSFASRGIRRFTYPDFDIGVDGYHTPPGLCDAICKKIRQLGYKVKINYPYAGAITPMKHYQKDKRVVSIMFEANRKLYMEGIKKSRDFEKTREICHALMACAAEYINIPFQINHTPHQQN